MGAYSNKIDLKSVFEHLGEERYVVCRLPEHFPNYMEYSDLDILCDDKNRIGSLVKDILSQYQGTTRVSSLPGRLHVDYFSSKTQLDIKFDLFDSFEIYNKTKVSKELKGLMLGKRTPYKGTYVPPGAFELALRFVEYLEYIDQRPDKIKHLRYMKNIDTSWVNELKRFTSVGLSVKEIREMIDAS
jgi:hypothetical protein